MPPKATKKEETSSEEEESYEYETESESSEKKPAAKPAAAAAKADDKKAPAAAAAKPAPKKEESESEEEESDEDESYEYETESESSEKKPAAKADDKKPAAAASNAAKADDKKPAAAAAAAKKKDESEEEEDSDEYEYESEYETESSEKKPAAKPAAATAAAAKPAEAKPAAAAAAKPAETKPAAATAATTSSTTTTTKAAAAPAAAPAAAAAPAQRALVAPTPVKLEGKTLVAAYIAEFLGTFLISFLIFQFRGQAITPGAIEPVGGMVSHALVQAFAVGAFTAAFGPLSGGHFNPTITWTLMILRQVEFVRGIIYTILQIAGGILGALLAWGLLPPYATAVHKGTGVGSPFTCTYPTDAASATASCWKEGFGAEIVGSYLVALAFTLVYVAGHGEIGYLSASLVYGIAVFAFHSTSNAFFNPARALGGAVFAFDYVWDNFWVWIIGPLIGAIGAALTFAIAFHAKEDRTKAAWFVKK